MPDWRPLPGPLAAEVTGEGPRIVFCHGFTQTSASWKPVAARLVDQGYEAVVVDLPGHGGSQYVCADLPASASLVVATAGSGAYVGYSLGGRVSLHAALAHSGQVEGLALLGAHPGLEDEEERMRRRIADEALAGRLLRIGVPAFLAGWIAQPLFAGLHLDAGALADRSRNTADGLASSLRLTGTGTQASLWPQLADLAVPVLVLAGEEDTKFLEMGRRLTAAVPTARFAAIACAGHAAHLQQPDAVGDELLAWMALRR